MYLCLCSAEAMKRRQTPLCQLLLCCQCPSPGDRRPLVCAGRQRLHGRGWAQPWSSLPLQREAAHVSLPGSLPAAGSAVINRGSDLASCLWLAGSDREFSFLTHQARKTKWVQVFRAVHLLDGKAERAPATCSWPLWKACWPFPSWSPDLLKVESLCDIELALTSTFTFCLREFSQST